MNDTEKFLKEMADIYSRKAKMAEDKANVYLYYIIALSVVICILCLI